MEPYVGEIRMFAGNFAPLGWAFCDGQILSVSQNDVLFSLIGTTYGGDGSTTFGLPDLRGRLPIHKGGNYQLGVKGGEENVTINAATTPSHSHQMSAYSSVANTPNPGNNLLGLSSQVSMFFGDPAQQAMNPGAITPTGGSQPHENRMPSLCIHYIISLFGIYPSRS